MTPTTSIWPPPLGQPRGPAQPRPVRRRRRRRAPSRRRGAGGPVLDPAPQPRRRGARARGRLRRRAGRRPSRSRRRSGSASSAAGRRDRRRAAATPRSATVTPSRRRAVGERGPRHVDGAVAEPVGLHHRHQLAGGPVRDQPVLARRRPTGRCRQPGPARGDGPSRTATATPVMPRTLPRTGP